MLRVVDQYIYAYPFMWKRNAFKLIRLFLDTVVAELKPKIKCGKITAQRDHLLVPPNVI